MVTRPAAVPDTTAEPSPPVAFQDKAIPFFRGRICSAPMQEVQTGSPIPVTFQPCLHPCISTNEYQFHNQYYCSGGTCDGFSVFWSIGSSENCPADAWGEFDPSMCVYDITSNTSITNISVMIHRSIISTSNSISSIAINNTSAIQ